MTFLFERVDQADQACYHIRRAAQERSMARRARCDESRRRHRELAEWHQDAVQPAEWRLLHV